MSDQMTPDQQLEQIQISKEQAESSVALWKAFENLRKNPDFDLLIRESYFQKEAARLVMLKADSSFVTPERQAALDNAMLGISNLNQYFNSIVQIGQMSEQSLEELAETSLEIQEEEVEGIS